MVGSGRGSSGRGIQNWAPRERGRVGDIRAGSSPVGGQKEKGPKPLTPNIPASRKPDLWGWIAAPSHEVRTSSSPSNSLCICTTGKPKCSASSSVVFAVTQLSHNQSGSLSLGYSGRGQFTM